MRRGRRRRGGGYGGRAMRRVGRPPPRRSSRGHYSPAAARGPRAICVVVSDTLCCARRWRCPRGSRYSFPSPRRRRRAARRRLPHSKLSVAPFRFSGRWATLSVKRCRLLLPQSPSNNAVSSLDSCLGLGDAAVVKTDGPQVLSTNAVAVLRAMIGGGPALGLIDAALATAGPVLFPGAFTADALVAAEIRKTAPIVGACLFVHALSVSLEGVLFATNDAQSVAKLYIGNALAMGLAFSWARARGPTRRSGAASSSTISCAARSSRRGWRGTSGIAARGGGASETSSRAGRWRRRLPCPSRPCIRRRTRRGSIRRVIMMCNAVSLLALPRLFGTKRLVVTLVLFHSLARRGLERLG